MLAHNIRLSITEADLVYGWLYNLELPPPVMIYRDHTEKRPAGRGGQATHGFISVELYWADVLTVRQADKLKTLVEDALDSVEGVLYVTADRKNGLNDWVDFKGTPLPIDVIPEDDMEDGGTYVEDISLIINALEIVNDPATGI